MHRHDDDADRRMGARGADEQGEHARPALRRPPGPALTPVDPRERCVDCASWPLGSVEDRELEARHDLEQVGRILQRLELPRAGVVPLRVETLAILAERAA